MRRPDRRHGVTLIRATVDEDGRNPFPAGAGRTGPGSRRRSRGRRRRPRPRSFSSAPTAGVTRAAHASACPSTTRWRSTSRRSGCGSRRTSAGIASRRTCSCCRTGSSSAGSRASAPPASSTCSARGRIPLDLYRGRTLYAPPVQAAEIAVRDSTGCDGVADLRLVAHDEDSVTFSTPVGVRVRTGRGAARARRPRELRCRARADLGLARVARWLIV